MQATIQLRYENARTAHAVANAISPDNLTSAKELQITTNLEDNSVITKIQCHKKLVTLIATIDDLLFCASTAERSLKIVEPK